jgi:hypothetical protein
MMTSLGAFEANRDRVVGDRFGAWNAFRGKSQDSRIELLDSSQLYFTGQPVLRRRSSLVAGHYAALRSHSLSSLTSLAARVDLAQDEVLH